MLSNAKDIFIGCESDYSDANIVLFGAPFDCTVSFRPGSRFAGKAIRTDSYGLETYSPYQNQDICDKKIFDAGDIELPFGNAIHALNMIENQAMQILNDGKVPFMIGGEHLTTLGAVRATRQKYPDLHIIHFDAHADLREDYLGETMSHATVIRRIWDLIGDDRIHQFGIRSGDRQEFEFAERHTDMHKYNLEALSESVKFLGDKPIYLTLDLDVLDPSVLPGTGTPEPGGVSFAQLHHALLSLKGLHIVGCDVTELAPAYDQSGVSTAVACKTIRELLLII